MIKNYIHLYLGCEAIVEKTTYHMVHNWGINTGDKIKIDGKLIHHIHNIIPFNGVIKPILRLLSDMIEEEKNKSNEFNVCSNLDLAEWFRYLLSKGFDLFGLIESGLAIDKTSLSNEKLIIA